MVKEGNLLAVFNSSPGVLKAESILKGLGLAIMLIPAPRQLLTDCGLALRFTETEHYTIMQTLAQQQLMPAFVCVYRGGVFVTTWSNEESQKHPVHGEDEQ